MAIIQISKIQQRSGNLVDLPQLDEAQFGWATDAKRLFIGKTSPNENIEVLTSYSNISFSQIAGSDGDNFNISNSTNGQILTFVALTNTWENWTGNASQLNNDKLKLGDLSNITIGGGATGYILETDGIGNLSWTSKGTLRSSIYALSNATPIVMKVANTTPYVNGLAVTISGANAANANTIVNGKTFYVKVAVDFPTSGNVTLYTTPDLAPGNAAAGTNLGTYTANSGISTALISGTGVSNAGGSVNTIQFNNSGVLNGSANFTISGGNLVTLNGNFVSGNINGGNLITGNFVTGRLTTAAAAQPNITSTGTLVSLSVSGNANIGNIGTGGLITATGNVRAGNLVSLGALSVTGNSNIGNLEITGEAVINGLALGNTGYASIIKMNNPIVGTTNPNKYLRLNNVGSLEVVNSDYSNVILGLTDTGNLTVNNLAVGTNIAVGGLITASGNIRGGNLVTSGVLSVTGNANIGNIGTGGLITATGNITGGNLITSGQVSATGNITGGNLITSGQVSATGNASVLGIKTDNYYYANGVAISFSGTYSNSNVASYLPTYTGTVGAGTATHYGTTLTTGANTTAGTITGNWTLSAGSRMQATYADLAEYYEADHNYEPGTVLEFGGDKEVTIAEDGTSRVAGVVSTDPAYVMNAKCKGEHIVALALQGRVPVKVRGRVRKGDMMVSAGDGYARPMMNPTVGTIIGKALANFDGYEGTIEIAVGRL